MMTANSITHVLIPAAGFGKRVGAPAAKELLKFDGEDSPLIIWCLDLCLRLNLKPVVISRFDKKELNQFLEQNKIKYNLEICLIEPSREWPDTILKSEKYWADKNILLLPDTRFSPINILSELEKSLDVADCTFATFKVGDPKTWGILKEENKKFYVAEKPLLGMRAWGLIAFQKQAGRELFEKILESNLDHQYKELNFKKIKTMDLSEFKDLTRIVHL